MPITPVIVYVIIIITLSSLIFDKFASLCLQGEKGKRRLIRFPYFRKTGANSGV